MTFIDQDRSIAVVIGRIDDGSWVAASKESPYFCFVGKSEAEVTLQVERALAFYSEHHAERVREVPTGGRQVIVQEIVPVRKRLFELGERLR